jgi:hypothetical protein
MKLLSLFLFLLPFSQKKNAYKNATMMRKKSSRRTMGEEGREKRRIVFKNHPEIRSDIGIGQ